MTDNEIIKALELCGSEFECHNGCPYYNNGQFKCRDLSIYRDALSLINRQKAEIERLRESRDRWRKIAEDFDRFSREEERMLENDKERT
jgi:hypothetical protein